MIEGVDASGKTTLCKVLSNRNKWKYLRTPTGIFREYNYKIEKLGDKPLAYIFFLSAILNTSYLIKKNLKYQKTIIVVVSEDFTYSLVAKLKNDEIFTMFPSKK